MKKCTIIGKTNVGKTLFFINFAEYLGLKYLDIEFHEKKEVTKGRLSIKGALTQLVNSQPHKTQCFQCLIVDIPIGKGKKKIQMIDTTGLIDGIHSDAAIRKAISQTLAVIRDSDIILHIIDASAVDKDDLPSAMGPVDYEIAQFGQLKRGYAILANKMDIPGSEQGLKKIREEFCGNLIIPISALKKTGFKEVKTFVAHNI